VDIAPYPKHLRKLEKRSRIASAAVSPQGHVARRGLGLTCYGWKDTKGNITKAKSSAKGTFHMRAGRTGILPVAGRLEACAARFRRVDAAFGMTIGRFDALT